MVSVRAATSFVTTAVLACVALAGCQPDFAARASSVEQERVLAVQSEPAEAAPGQALKLSALVVDPSGTRKSEAIDWGFCTRPKPLDELNDVSILCFQRSADWIVPLGVGPSIDGQLPLDACRQWGSDVPEPLPGQPAGRPADPDSTGGYFQPERLVIGSGGSYLLALGQTRVVCGLPGATRDVLEAFKKSYTPNANPTIADVTLAQAGGEAGSLPDDDASTPPAPAAPVRVHPGETVSLAVSWPACDSPPCGGAEPYPYYDLQQHALVSRRESMRVSYFASAGSFRDDRVGRAEDEHETAVENAWTAPATPPEGGVVHLWFVLRDARGGVSFRGAAVRVE
jgi:hypothetical protein